MNLTEFLLARIAEDETTARSALNAAKWVCVQNDHGGDLSRPVTAEVWTEPFESALTAGPRALVVCVVGSGGEFPSLTHDTFDARHIARFDPQRMLSECEAKRRTIEDCTFVLAGVDDDDGPRRRLATGILWKMAWPYADHADYNEAWRPDDNP